MIPTTFIDNSTTATSLAYSELESNYKFQEIVLGVSSLLFFPNIGNFASSQEESLSCLGCTQIPNVQSFPKEGSSIGGANLLSKPRTGKAKIKKKYILSDEELEKRLSANTPSPILDEENTITDFVNHNSGRLISGLEKWL